MYVNQFHLWIVRDKSLFSANAIIPSRGEGQDIGSVSRVKFRQAIDFGQSFSKNVTDTTSRIRFKSSYSTKSAESVHSQFLKPRKNVPKMSDSALTSAFAAKVLKKGEKNIVTIYISGYFINLYLPCPLH